MKSSPSDKRQYKSFFKEGYVTEANYITELVFKKRFEKLEKASCPQKVWNTKKHNGPYKGQLIQAHKLLKKYHGISIIKAIQSREADFIFKLQDKKLIPIIERFEREYQETEVKLSDKTEKTKMKPFSKSKNRLADL